MIPIESPEEIFKWDLKTLWEAINVLDEQEIIEKKEILIKIKHGVHIKLPIIYIIKEWYIPYPPTKKVSVQGYGKYEIQEFYDEIDERKSLIRKILLDNIQQGDTEPRT